MYKTDIEALNKKVVAEGSLDAFLDLEKCINLSPEEDFKKEYTYQLQMKDGSDWPIKLLTPLSRVQVWDRLQCEISAYHVWKRAERIIIYYLEHRPMGRRLLCLYFFKDRMVQAEEDFPNVGIFRCCPNLQHIMVHNIGIFASQEPFVSMKTIYGTFVQTTSLSAAEISKTFPSLTNLPSHLKYRDVDLTLFPCLQRYFCPSSVPLPPTLLNAPNKIRELVLDGTTKDVINLLVKSQLTLQLENLSICLDAETGINTKFMAPILQSTKFPKLQSLRVAQNDEDDMAYCHYIMWIKDVSNLQHFEVGAVCSGSTMKHIWQVIKRPPPSLRSLNVICSCKFDNVPAIKAEYSKKLDKGGGNVLYFTHSGIEAFSPRKLAHLGAWINYSVLYAARRANKGHPFVGSLKPLLRDFNETYRLDDL
jgi:hypothetical protein